MSNQDFHKTSLDDAIDSAVRGIIQLDPRPGLRRRVLSQLDASSASTSWTPRLLVSFGALATITLAVLVLTREPRVSVVAPAPGTGAAPAPAPVVAAAAPLVNPAPVIGATAPSNAVNVRRRVSRVPARNASESIFGRRRGRVSAASVDPSGSSIEAALPADGFNRLPALVLPALIIEPLNLDALPGRIRKTP
jgi:hypothetical protein